MQKVIDDRTEINFLFIFLRSLGTHTFAKASEYDSEGDSGSCLEV